MGVTPHVFWFSKKRALFSLAFILVISGVVVGYGLWTQYHRVEGQAKRLEAALGTPSELLADADGDGLKTWEETLWGTDPEKQDTDGDGVSDGEEARAGRSPKEEGAGTIAGAEVEPARLAADGVTSELARAFINESALGALGQGSTNPLSQAEIQRLSESYAGAEKKFIEGSAGVLRYDANNDPEFIKRYLNGVAELLFHAYDSVEKGDLEIVEEVLRDSDPSDMKKLDPYIAATETLAKQYAALTSPTALKTFHEEGVRLLKKTEFELAVMRNIERDPVSALIAVQNRILTKILLTRLYDEQVLNWLRATKITFADDELGHQMFAW